MGFFKRSVPTVDSSWLPGYLRGESGYRHAGREEARVDLLKAASVSLTKAPKMQRPWAVYMVADVSGSMNGYLADGSLDYLTEAILSAVDRGGWDADRIIPVIGYAERACAPFRIGLGNASGFVPALRRQMQRDRVTGYGTSYASAVEAVVADYRASEDYGKRPAVVFFQSDGIDGDPAATARLLTEYSDEPIHWVLVYYGRISEGDSGNAASMLALDEGTSMRGRTTDNVSMFIAGPEPKRVTPEELYEGLLTGPNAWLEYAPRDGVHIPS